MSYNNTAYDYDYISARNSSAAPKGNNQRKAQIQRIPVKQQKTSPYKSILTGFFVAACAVFMICYSIYVRIEISETKSEISKVEAQIEQLNSQETKLKMQLENKISYSNIEQAAKELGMQKKSTYQVHYIDTSQKCKTEVLSGN